ncbi:hypothetical protein Scel_81110 [Streptomyces cellostaticus]|nr:hypothetical protein Scel_81110 [Streptomyces cellostaticus]
MGGDGVGGLPRLTGLCCGWGAGRGGGGGHAVAPVRQKWRIGCPWGGFPAATDRPSGVFLSDRMGVSGTE